MKWRGCPILVDSARVVFFFCTVAVVVAATVDNGTKMNPKTIGILLINLI